MGGGNSSDLAGRYGQCLLRMLREQHDLFSTDQGEANCWWTKIQYECYDPTRGHGFVFLRKDGRPSVRMWVHVDDFLIHGPDLESTQQGLSFFLDLSVKVGMLCHPGKLYPLLKSKPTLD
jgi:hypothetical protein